MKKTIAVLGGDLRQVHLANLLLEDGWDVVTWGLEKTDGPNQTVLADALERDVLIFPLPMCRGGQLNLPLSQVQMPPDRLWPRIAYNRLLLGGITGELSGRLLKDYGITLVDYYAREELQVANAAITAEGAVQRAMEETDQTLLARSALVLGFGRIGKLLARRLQAMGTRVTVAARRAEALAWAEALGYGGVFMSKLSGDLGQFDLIFNTVPVQVLTGPLLARTKADCLLMELASQPGGIDAEAAVKLGRHLVSAPGLPGLVAPKAAARAVRNTIYHILEERGDPI